MRENRTSFTCLLRELCLTPGHSSCFANRLKEKQRKQLLLMTVKHEGNSKIKVYEAEFTFINHQECFTADTLKFIYNM